MRQLLVVLIVASAACAAYAPPKTPNLDEKVRTRAGEELGCTPESVRVKSRPEGRAGSYFTYDVTACDTVATYTCRFYRERCFTKECVPPLELFCTHDASASFEHFARKKAARDLSCDDVALRPRPDLGLATFDATGCGAAARYACFEAPDASNLFHVTCRGRPMDTAAVAPTTWGAR
jgi:hypothetical protein